MPQSEEHKAIVVGAGAGGLVALKELIEAGVDDVCLVEKSVQIGGLFAKSYDGLFLTSSAAFSMFSDFPFPHGSASDFWTKKQATDYWSAYATKFDLWQYIRFETDVLAANRSDGHCWEMSTSQGMLRCAHLVVATGNNVVPTSPDWADNVTNIPTLHSSEYRNSNVFKGKNALIVGGGESGSDITLEIASVAKRTVVSLRNGPGWIVPRLRGTLAADISTHRAFWTLPYQTGREASSELIAADKRRGQNSPVLAEVARLNEKVASPTGIRGAFGTKSLGLPRAIVEHGAEVVGGISQVAADGKTLIREDNTKINDIDVILFATGYRTEVPFLQHSVPLFDPRAWFKNIFVPELGDELAFIGFARPTFGSQFPVMEMQARYLAQVLSGRTVLKTAAEMKAEIQKDGLRLTAQFGATGDRVRGLVDYAQYMDELAGLIGCRPRLWRLLGQSPRLWLKVMFGPMQGTQFRLFGPGRKPSTARQILLALPTSPFNHIVKAGLRARFRLAIGKKWRSAR